MSDMSGNDENGGKGYGMILKAVGLPTRATPIALALTNNVHC